MTPRQRDVLEAFIALWRARGHAPSLQEVAARLRITASSVAPHVQALEQKGYVRREHGRSRSVVPLHDAEGFALSRPAPAHRASAARDDDEVERVSILGEIAAGLPLEANEHVLGEVVLSRALVGASGERKVFALRVRGESMIGDGILCGDLILVVPRSTAREGEIVVALIDGEATVKRFHRRGEVVALLPSNSKVEPILIGPRDGQDVRILGVVVSVHRTLAGPGAVG